MGPAPSAHHLAAVLPSRALLRTALPWARSCRPCPPFGPCTRRKGQSSTGRGASSSAGCAHWARLSCRDGGRTRPPSPKDSALPANATALPPRSLTPPRGCLCVQCCEEARRARSAAVRDDHRVAAADARAPCRARPARRGRGGGRGRGSRQGAVRGRGPDLPLPTGGAEAADRSAHGSRHPIQRHSEHSGRAGAHRTPRHRDREHGEIRRRCVHAGASGSVGALGSTPSWLSQAWCRALLPHLRCTACSAALRPRSRARTASWPACATCRRSSCGGARTWCWLWPTLAATACSPSRRGKTWWRRCDRWRPWWRTCGDSTRPTWRTTVQGSPPGTAPPVLPRRRLGGGRCGRARRRNSPPRRGPELQRRGRGAACLAPPRQPPPAVRRPRPHRPAPTSTACGPPVRALRRRTGSRTATRGCRRRTCRRCPGCARRWS